MIGLGCKMTIIVPIGVDCGVANFLRDNGYRNFSLPFDWVVSYGCPLYTSPSPRD